MLSRPGFRPSAGFVSPKRRTQRPILNRARTRMMRELEASCSLSRVRRVLTHHERRLFELARERRQVLGLAQLPQGSLDPQESMPIHQESGSRAVETGAVSNAVNGGRSSKLSPARWKSKRRPPGPPLPSRERKILFSEGSMLLDPGIDLDRVRFHRANVKRAPRHHWPFGPDGRLLWPSYPTPGEVLASGRSDLIRCNTTVLVDNTISRRELDFNDPRLLNNILGVRADVEVPLRYLAFFEYRWNMLILARRDKVPRLLRKFLINLWRVKRHSLWLRRPTHLGSYTRLLSCTPEVFLGTPQKKS